MDDIRYVIEKLGGAAKALELRAAGATTHGIRTALRIQAIRRPRKGWYVLAETPPDLFAAVRVGGRATCVTALRHHGVWLTQPPGLTHVAVHRSATQLRSVADRHVRQTLMPDAVVHWVDTATPRRLGASRLLESPFSSLSSAFACSEGEDLFATVESALHLNLLTKHEWSTISRKRDASGRRVGPQATSLSGSGLESIASFRLRRLGIPFRQQIQIGPDRVDFLLGSRLIIEIDGERFHERHQDRVRDARLVARGFVVLHFDYLQIFEAWSTVVAAIATVMARGDHEL